jgi:hypothetical protein
VVAPVYILTQCIRILAKQLVFSVFQTQFGHLGNCAVVSGLALNDLQVFPMCTEFERLFLTCLEKWQWSWRKMLQCLQAELFMVLAQLISQRSVLLWRENIQVYET